MNITGAKRRSPKYSCATNSVKIVQQQDGNTAKTAVELQAFWTSASASSPGRFTLEESSTDSHRWALSRKSLALLGIELGFIVYVFVCVCVCMCMWVHKIISIQNTAKYCILHLLELPTTRAATCRHIVLRLLNYYPLQT